MSLSPLGIFHTLVAIAAIAAVCRLLWQDRQVRLDRPLARFYLAATVLAALSALGIYNHGGPNAAHGLAVLTLLAVAAGIIAAKSSMLGWLQQYVVALCFSSTILFHLLPAATEVLTRFPMDAPLVGSLQDPLLLRVFSVIVVIFLLGLAAQFNWLRRQAA